MVSRWDTLKYEFIDTGQVDELNFVEIRFNITNGLPLGSGNKISHNSRYDHNSLD